jgi:hypothetical protein
LDNLKPGEPFFVLRAQDKLSPGLIREWAVAAAQFGASAEKVREALATADAMEQWPVRKYPD